jgi:hypothetical protein
MREIVPNPLTPSGDLVKSQNNNNNNAVMTLNPMGKEGSTASIEI